MVSAIQILALNSGRVASISYVDQNRAKKNSYGDKDVYVLAILKDDIVNNSVMEINKKATAGKRFSSWEELPYSITVFCAEVPNNTLFVRRNGKCVWCGNSVLEHATYNLVIQGVSRALTHELVRHRAGFAISQESQRYVDAKNVKFVVPPILWHIYSKTGDASIINNFIEGCVQDVNKYQELQKAILDNADNMKEAQDLLDKSHTVLRKRANEAARACLPNAAETKLVWTGNLRSLRHFCELRGGLGADLEIRRLAVEITRIMKQQAPHTFADFTILEGDYGVGYVSTEHHKV